MKDITKRLCELSLALLILMPASSFGIGADEAILEKYFLALAYSSPEDLDALLAPDFEYLYFKDGRQERLSRRQEMKSVTRLIPGSIGHPDLLRRDRRNPQRFHVITDIDFRGMVSPPARAPADSIFWGSRFVLDEMLSVTIKNGRISKIVESKAKGNNKLSFGYLKQIYSSDAKWSSAEDKSELRSTAGNILLITRRLDTEPDSVSEIYYWPDKRVVEGFDYSKLVLLADEQPEMAAIKSYLLALWKEDFERLDSLLAPDFEFHYSQAGKLVKLSREDELNGLRQLFLKEVNNNFVAPAEMLVQGKKDKNEFHVGFYVFFDALPKIRGACETFCDGEAKIDEVWRVTLRNNRISRILVLKENERKSDWSWGSLKTVHVQNFRNRH